MKKLYQNSTVASVSNRYFKTYLNESIVMIDNLTESIDLPEQEKRLHMSNPYRHDASMTILLCVEGTVDFSIGLSSYRMNANEALVVGSGILCEIKDMTFDTKFCSMTFDENFYFPVLNNSVSSVLRNRVSKEPICPLPDGRMDECVNIYKTIKNRLSGASQDVLLAEVVKGYIQAMLYNLYSSYILQEETSKKEEHKMDRKENLFNRFIELLQRDYMRERNIKYYAAQLCVTPRYLSQVVYKVSGHFASEHIDDMVIAEAKRLIMSRQHTIQQISEELHFTSLSFFGRYFKKITGYSPTQYQDLDNRYKE